MQYVSVNKLKQLVTIFTILILLSTCFLSGIKPSLAENNNASPLINPIADANGPYFGIINQPVTFNGSNSYDPDGTITYFAWCCGDGNAVEGEIANHIYTKTGTFKLLLIVVDDDGNLDTNETKVIINDDLPPTIEIINPMKNSFYFKNHYIINLDNRTIIYGSTNVSVNANDDVGINKVEFYIDGSLKFTDYIAPYYWEIPESHFKHNLNVIAYDLIGQQSNEHIDFIQWKSHPIIIFIFLLRLIKNQDSNLKWIKDENRWNSLLIDILNNLKDKDFKNNKEINNIIEYLRKSTDKIKTKIIIEFLNNHPYLKNKFQKNYPLIYIILFYIKNEDSILKERILQEFYDRNTLINILFSIIFKDENLIFSKDSIQNIIDLEPIQWIKEHPYMTVGLILLVILLANQILSKDKNINDTETEETKENTKPIANIEGPNIGIINKPINFSAEDSYDTDGKIIKYTWDFGDGNTGSGINTQHIYLLPGNYKVTLSIIDDNGETNYDYLNIEIIKNNLNEFENNNQNLEFVLISGALSTILLIGLIVLKLRRNFFE